MKVEDVITGIVVCWNTKELVEKSVSSILKFHPELRILIVDGSDIGSECYEYTSSIANKRIHVWHTGYNIGHGRGMNKGITQVNSPYVLFFDSDIEMVKSPLQDMLDMMEENTYGVGYIEYVGFDGFEYGVHETHKRMRPIKYLHPYFQLVQVKEYRKYKPYIHHGAPCITTMLDLHRRGLSDKVLKEFPGLGHTNGKGLLWEPCKGEYIIHNVEGFGGTGRMRLEIGLPHIEGKWERIAI